MLTIALLFLAALGAAGPTAYHAITGERYASAHPATMSSTPTYIGLGEEREQGSEKERHA